MKSINLYPWRQAHNKRLIVRYCILTTLSIASSLSIAHVITGILQAQSPHIPHRQKRIACNIDEKNKRLQALKKSQSFYDSHRHLFHQRERLLSAISKKLPNQCQLTQISFNQAQGTLQGSCKYVTNLTAFTHSLSDDSNYQLDIRSLIQKQDQIHYTIAGETH